MPTDDSYSYSPSYVTVVGSLLGLVLTAILILVFIHFKGTINLLEFKLYHLVILFLLTILHEFIHIFIFVIQPESKLSDIKLGFNRKYLMPYVHCSAKIRVDAYRRSTAAPANFLGWVPSCVGFLTGNSIIFLFGVVMLAGSIGDIMILWKIRKLNRNQLVMDHPTRVGCELVENNS